MKLCGLTHQHKSLEGLLESFPESHERDSDLGLVPTPGRLLRYLLTIDGPDLWVGSSLSVLNFVARDTVDEDDRVPPLAFAFASGGCYRIEYPAPRELNVPDEAMVCFTDADVHQAATHLITAIEHSDANPSRVTASWHWYVCPACRHHHAVYRANCVGCGKGFPTDKKCQALGILRRPEIPDGAVAPRKHGHCVRL